MQTFTISQPQQDCSPKNISKRISQISALVGCTLIGVVAILVIFFTLYGLIASGFDWGLALLFLYIGVIYGGIISVAITGVFLPISLIAFIISKCVEDDAIVYVEQTDFSSSNYYYDPSQTQQQYGVQQYPIQQYPVQQYPVQQYGAAPKSEYVIL